MTINAFRKLALGLPETSESAHMGHPDFRVRGKIFATLCYPNEDWGMIKLKPDQQREFVQANSAVFSPVKGGWGRRGATKVLLKPAQKSVVRDALRLAWRNSAPKRVVEEFGALF